MDVTDERSMLMNEGVNGRWLVKPSVILELVMGVFGGVWGWGALSLAPLRHRSGEGATLAPLQLLGPLERPPGAPCVSVCYCSHCTHRLLHLHVAHGGVWGGFGPVGQLLVAAGLGVQQVGQ